MECVPYSNNFFNNLVYTLLSHINILAVQDNQSINSSAVQNWTEGGLYVVRNAS